MATWHASQWNRFLNSLELRFNRVRLRSRPWSIMLETTTRCNLRCIQCSRRKMFGKGEDLDPAVLDRVAKELLPYAQEFIASYYGEPLLYPHIDRVFQIVKNQPHLSAGFYTNGLLLNERTIDQILHAGFSFLNISIDGASKRTYENIRIGGNFDHLCHNLEVLRRKRDEWEKQGGRHLSLTMKIVGMRENIEEAPLFVEMGHRYGFDNVFCYVNMTVDDERMAHSALNHHQELANRMFQAGAKRARELGVRTDFWVTPFPDAVEDRHKNLTTRKTSTRSRLGQWLLKILNWRDLNVRAKLYHNHIMAGGNSMLAILLLGIRAFCRVTPVSSHLSGRRAEPNCFGMDQCGNPWSYTAIRTDGTVMPCCFISYSLGNLQTQNFEAIWNGDSYRSLRSSLVKRRYLPQCALATCNYIEGVQAEKYRYEWMETPDKLKVASGTKKFIQIKVRNAGPLEWKAPEQEPVNFVSLGYHLFDENHKLIREGIHVPVGQTIPYGETAGFEMPLPSDLTPGIYYLHLDMVHEFVTWFSYRGQDPHEIRLQLL